IAPASAGRPEAPFTPIAGVADYVVTMVEPTTKGDITHTVTHHGTWTRVDIDEGGYRATGYFPAGGLTAVGGNRKPSGDIVSALFLRGREQRNDRETDPRNTGERQTLLGETCTVWNVRRSTYSGAALLSCVTDDGIELWHKYASRTGESFFAKAT